MIIPQPSLALNAKDADNPGVTRYRTSYWLWLLVSAIIFVAIGHFSVLDQKRGGYEPLTFIFGILRSRHEAYYAEALFRLGALLFYSIGGGWIGQAIIMVACNRTKQNNAPTSDETNP